jgi:hypothetical protein|tara:strand:- start:67 stop:438 length:372 start_codon:yes stop_codon:yes gene_type:complete
MHKKGDRPRFNKRQYFTMPIDKIVDYYGLASVRDDMTKLLEVVKLAKTLKSDRLELSFGQYNNVIITARGIERREMLKKASRLGKRVFDDKTYTLILPVDLEILSKREKQMNKYLLEYAESSR